jgi:hypothetical protein
MAGGVPVIERVIVRAEEIGPGDWLVEPVGPIAGRMIGPTVSGVVGDTGTVEVFTGDDPMGMPAATYEVGATVTVWREVSR